MYLEIPHFLTDNEIRKCRSIAESGVFVDGLSTSRGMSQTQKHNEQLQPNKEQSAFLDATLKAAFQRNYEAQAFTQASEVRTPILSRYASGMYYKPHIDSPTLQLGDEKKMRTDLSMTVFLSDPDTYDGGALVLETDFGDIECKPLSGTAIIYSTLLWHEVEAVTRGTRLALVTWFQSQIRNPINRSAIFDISMSWREVSTAAPESEAAKRLNKTLANLLRIWSD